MYIYIYIYFKCRTITCTQMIYDLLMVVSSSMSVSPLPIWQSFSLRRSLDLALLILRLGLCGGDDPVIRQLHIVCSLCIPNTRWLQGLGVSYSVKITCFKLHTGFVHSIYMYMHGKHVTDGIICSCWPSGSIDPQLLTIQLCYSILFIKGRQAWPPQ